MSLIGTNLAERYSNVAGKFVTLEGIDGSGKSTQIARVANMLEEDGYRVVRTREPGGSPGAESIRDLLLNGDVDRWSFETEILLFNAARRDHLERTVLPALEDGAIVLCDRFADTTRAYQANRSPERAVLVEDIHELVIGIEPHLTILLDIHPETSLSRAVERSKDGAEMRMEGRGLEFQRAAREGFLAIAKKRATVKVIGANCEVSVLTAAIMHTVSPFIQNIDHQHTPAL